MPGMLGSNFKSILRRFSPPVTSGPSSTTGHKRPVHPCGLGSQRAAALESIKWCRGFRQIERMIGVRWWSRLLTCGGVQQSDCAYVSVRDPP
jgi:hypothetical protein